MPPASAANSSPSTPDRIGRFIISDTLGRGAQGVVYLANDPKLDRTVAIKTLRQRGTDHASLLREARTVAGFQHANIVPVFEVGEADGQPYIVYAHITGQSLARTLVDGGAMAPHQAVDITLQVLDALSYSHAQQVVHRDLKPANILITDGKLAQVLDFGIAELAGTQTASRSRITGTVNYLAPELLSGGTVTPTVDLFAMGLILYEMVTGTAAVSNADPMAAMYRIAHDTIDAPSVRVTELDAEFDAIIARALEKDPEHRYRSAAEMHDALTGWLDQKQDSGTDGSGQSTLAFLLRRMRKKSDFPAVSQHIAEINQKISSASDTSVNDLANIILKDYSLTTKLLRLVNSSFYGSHTGRVSTISRAIVILGFKQVRMAAMSLMLFEHMDNQPHADTVKEAAGKSFLAGNISRRLATRIKLPNAEQAFVCAMFCRLGRYLTTYYFAEEFRDIDRLMKNQGLDESTASRRVLGISFEEIGIGVGREWKLPDEVLTAMRPIDADGVLDKPRNKREGLHQLSAFSEQLTQVIVDTPANEQDQALAALRDKFGQTIRLDKQQLKGIVSDALDDIRTYASAAKTAQFGNRQYFQSAQQWTSDNKTAPQDQAADVSPDSITELSAPAESKVLAPDNEAVLNGIQDITAALVEGCALNEILVMILETVFRGLKFNRVLFCIRNNKQKKMVARFGLGKDIDQILERFQFPVQGRDLFSLAASSGKITTWGLTRAGKDAGQRPQWHIDMLGNLSECVVVPIMLNDCCIGLIYTDLESTGRRVSGNDLNYLNTLVGQAALAIKQKR